MGRRAVSGAITGMFVVLIFVAAISALLAYNTSQDKYNQAVSERNQMEWERLNEKVTMPSAERLDDGTLNATIQNIGAVTAHLVSLWLSAYDANGDPQWQRQHSIDIRISPGEVKTNLGQDTYTYVLIRPGQTGQTVTSIMLPNASWTYTIKTVTERGNVAIYVLQPPVAEESEQMQFNGQPVPLIITFNQESFQYTTKGLYPTWMAAWVKPRKSTSAHQIYRINVTNISGKDIVLLSSSHMRQEADDVSDVETVWWIVDPNTNPNSNDPIEFTSQTIENGEWAYIYFAASSEGGGNWQGDPTDTHYYTVFIHIFFHFEGESVYYGQTIGIMGQRLT